MTKITAKTEGSGFWLKREGWGEAWEGTVRHLLRADQYESLVVGVWLNTGRGLFLFVLECGWGVGALSISMESGRHRETMVLFSCWGKPQGQGPLEAGCGGDMGPWAVLKASQGLRASVMQGRGELPPSTMPTGSSVTNEKVRRGLWVTCVKTYFMFFKLWWTVEGKWRGEVWEKGGILL